MMAIFMKDSLKDKGFNWKVEWSISETHLITKFYMKNHLINNYLILSLKLLEIFDFYILHKYLIVIWIEV